MVVGWKRCRLEHENVGAANVFLDLDKYLHIGESAHHRLGKRRCEIGGDCVGKGGIGVAGDKLDRPIIRPHHALPTPAAPVATPRYQDVAEAGNMNATQHRELLWFVGPMRRRISAFWSSPG